MFEDTDFLLWFVHYAMNLCSEMSHGTSQICAILCVNLKQNQNKKVKEIKSWLEKRKILVYS
jgi:hypothetical protein